MPILVSFFILSSCMNASNMTAADNKVGSATPPGSITSPSTAQPPSDLINNSPPNVSQSGPVPNESKSATVRAMIRKDYEGDFRTVEGTRLVDFVHHTPYHWTATLTFKGDARPIMSRLAAHLVQLGFTPIVGRETIIEVKNGQVSGCLVGAIDLAGNGSCTFRAGLLGGRGLVDVSVDKPGSEPEGRVMLDRHYEHRVPGDKLGPPYPPPEQTGRVRVEPRSER